MACTTLPTESPALEYVRSMERVAVVKTGGSFTSNTCTSKSTISDVKFLLSITFNFNVKIPSLFNSSWLKTLFVLILKHYRLMVPVTAARFALTTVTAVPPAPITTLAAVSNVTPGAALMTIVVVPAPPNAAFNTPVASPLSRKRKNKKKKEQEKERTRK